MPRSYGSVPINLRLWQTGHVIRTLHAGRVLESGHNKWSKIRHSKGAIDAERAKLFSRLSNDIAVAAKLGGTDAHFNIRLAACLASAKKADMPKTNIEAALNRGAGRGSSSAMQNLQYEGNLGPVGFIIEVLTDNKTRTIANIKAMLKKAGGTVSPAAFLFDHTGYIRIHSHDHTLEQMEEIAIDAGAHDVIERANGHYEFTTAAASLNDVANALRAAGLELLQAELRYAPKDILDLEDTLQIQVEDLVQDLEADADIVKVICNARRGSLEIDLKQEQDAVITTK